jgi:uncharacterized coiled-coil DUF342 family protein
LGSDAETSLLTQIQKLRTEQNDNNNSLKEKFDEFGEILKKNNTEALVEVMKSATEAFNEQMHILEHSDSRSGFIRTLFQYDFFSKIGI